MTAADWSRRLSVGREAVDAGGEERLHGGRHLHGWRGPAPGDSARAHHQGAGLDQRADALLQEERVAFGPLDQERLERLKPGSSPSSAIEQFVGALRRQRIDPELGVVALVPPAVAVLGAVVDQQEEPGGRKALNQAVEDCLGLGVDPVQILEDQQSSGWRWLSRSSRRLTASSVRWRRWDGSRTSQAGSRLARRECQEGRQGRLQGRIQDEELAEQLLPDLGAGRPEPRSGSRL